MNTEYDDRHIYGGKELWAAFKAMSPKRTKSVLKSAYRDEGKKVKQIAARTLGGSGIAHSASVGKSIRVRVFPKGTGFMVTVKPHGGGRNSKGSTSRGFHKTRHGNWKPIALWVNGGTKERRVRHQAGRRPVLIGDKWKMTGRRRGSMKAYDFMSKSESQSVSMVETDMGKAIEKAVDKNLNKAGLVMG